MDDKYLGGLLSVILVYIIVISIVIVDNIYTSEIHLYLIHVGTATSIILLIIGLVLSIDSEQQDTISNQSITVEPAEETESEDDEDEVIEVGILEEFKEDSSEDKKP